MKKVMSVAVIAMTAGSLAMAGPADAHKRKHKHNHKRPVAERVVVHRYVVGQRLPRTYYSNRTHYVRPSMYQLPPAPYGYEYVRVGNAVYLTQTETGMISQVISNLLR